MRTACLGREGLQRQLASALGSSRWVTVVGPPGCGKTLLVQHALEAADGVTVWVEAQGLRTVEEFPRACLDALGAEVAPGDDPELLLVRALDEQHALLVLDGLDLDLPGVCDRLVDLLATTRDVRLVVTSVTTSRHPDERVIPVGPLPLPGAEGPLSGAAVELFVSRLEAAGGRPVHLQRDAEDVRRLLEATGGLPLLVEHAAVQAATLGLDNATTSGSLAEALQASYDLLAPEQQSCLRRLAAVPGPVGVGVLAELLAAGRDDVRSVVGGLIHRSLAHVREDGRIDLLWPVRAHGLVLATVEDHEAVRAGLLRWADRVAPRHDNYGAADAPWLVDLPAMRHAVTIACANEATRDLGYELANRIFSSLYTSMRTREAVEILEAVLTSGDGPAAIGAQVARRAGIAASESRGCYEGLWLLDRADQHAAAADVPAEQLAKNASIRAEMHLDAGELRRAEREAQRALDLDPRDSITRQAARTLAEVFLSSGRLAEAGRTARGALPTTDTDDERWITLAARTLLARIALEQGRSAEARAALLAVVLEARDLAEDRVGLLAETWLRELDPAWEPAEVQREQLPWAVRVPVLAQDARELLRAGATQRAAGLAADLVALADAAGLGRDALAARLLLGRSLLALEDTEQATTTFLAALEDAQRMPMPLRVADALDGLASVAELGGRREARGLAAAANGIRVVRRAVPWGYAARHRVDQSRAAPPGWVHDGDLTSEGHRAVLQAFSTTGTDADSPFEMLTSAERQVADRVADGLTSRQIAEELFVSPRTVDAHLAHIYRKLDISSRARLAAMVVDQR